MFYINLGKDIFLVLVQKCGTVGQQKRIYKQLVKLYVLVMLRTRFRVNQHSIVAWMARNSLLEAGGKSEG